MRLSKAVLAAGVVVAGGALCGATAVAVASPASASTIKNGWVQLCAQGNYDAYFDIPSTPIPGTGEVSQERESTIVEAGTCGWWPEDTSGATTTIKVYGIYNVSHQRFYIGGEGGYRSSATGVGIGAEGTSTSPWLQRW